MAHLSKQQLDPKHLRMLSKQFEQIIASLNAQSSPLFLDELLGEEEKVMLAKRLAAIIMFMEGNSSYRVWQLLKLSPSTADRIGLNYENGKYAHIETALKSKKSDYERLWETLEIILRAGMPPMGRGRWKSVFKS